MSNSDTIRLLRECDSGTKMAVSSIDQLMDKAADDRLVSLLQTSKEHHERLGDRIHGLLLDYNSDDKEPAAMAKGMSWLKSNVMMTMDKSDSTIADLITDGCNMGIKSLNRYLNQYTSADTTSKDICSELIKTEDNLAYGLRSYL